MKKFSLSDTRQIIRVSCFAAFGAVGVFNTHFVFPLLNLRVDAPLLALILLIVVHVIIPAITAFVLIQKGYDKKLLANYEKKQEKNGSYNLKKETRQ